MNAASKALWRRRLNYRRKRVSHWRARGNIGRVNHWLALVREAKRKLGLEPAAKPSPKPRENIKGIDVYEGDGNIDWVRVKQARQEFGICKVSEGEDWADPSYSRRRVDEMRKAGVAVGVYHFLRPKKGRSGAVEMSYFMAQAKAAGWGRRGDIRPVIDFEATTLSPAKTLIYLTQAINELKRLTGKPPIIYTGGPFWNENTDSCRDNYGCALWLAAYVKDPQQYLPAAWAKANWTIWQHTATGKIDGVAAPNVDQNVARFLPLL